MALNITATNMLSVIGTQGGSVPAAKVSRGGRYWWAIVDLKNAGLVTMTAEAYTLTDAGREHLKGLSLKDGTHQKSKMKLKGR